MSHFLPETDPSVRKMTRRASYPRLDSFSSSSSSSSTLRNSYQSDPYSPFFSHCTALKISGIPFSWEKLPGIPKKQTTPNKNKDLVSPLSRILPLPPPTNSKNTVFSTELIPRKKKSNRDIKDPFLAAFVECCKNDYDDQEVPMDSHWKVAKTARNPTDWYGFVNLSCKRSCSVSESIVYVPRSGKNHNYRGHTNSYMYRG